MQLRASTGVKAHIRSNTLTVQGSWRHLWNCEMTTIAHVILTQCFKLLRFSCKCVRDELNYSHTVHKTNLHSTWYKSSCSSLDIFLSHSSEQTQHTINDYNNNKNNMMCDPDGWPTWHGDFLVVWRLSVHFLRGKGSFWSGSHSTYLANFSKKFTPQTWILTKDCVDLSCQSRR